MTSRLRFPSFLPLFPAARPGTGRQWLVLALLFSLFGIVEGVHASQGGRSGFSGNPGTNAGAVCSVCHAPDGAPASTVTLTGPTTIDAGTVHEYLVTISGGPAITAGVGVSVSDSAGSLAPVGTDLQVLDGELTHNGPKAFAAGSATFSFFYTAPNYDAELTLYAASNSSNAGLDLSGDAIASTRLAVTVQNGFEPPPPPPPPATGELEAELFASGLAFPVVITNAGDGRLFVVEQGGVIRVIEPDGTVLPTPFLDISSQVDTTGPEQGLLGLAFHPNYSRNGFFFVYYSTPSQSPAGISRISRFKVTPDPDVAFPGSEKVILEFEQPYRNHNAGDLHFGPDGLLYIASGDGGSAGDPDDYSQNPQVLLGKMLRIDVNVIPGTGDATDCDISGSNSYRTPANNAFADGSGGAGCDEIYVLGARNPWRFSFDRLTGAMWVADVGQSAVEEIDYVPAGASGGLNLGWRCYEGSQPYNLADCTLDYQPPVYEYTRELGDCSVTGGFVYRGQSFPVLDGQYFFTDFCRASIRALSGPLGALTEREVLPEGILAAPSTFGEDVNGEMYVADIANGTIYRLLAVLEPGDVDGDGDVDRDDVRAINMALGRPADGPDDRRDVNGDGYITRQDQRAAVLGCTRPMCATE